jgi:predicted kinase
MNSVSIPSHQELVIVRGHPGSGKTTFSKQFVEKGYKHFENDSFFTDANGVYKFDFAFHQAAKDACFQNAVNALLDAHSVVVSNTYTKLQEMQELLDFANEVKIPVRIFEMYHNFDNVHNVPAEVVEDKKISFEQHPDAIQIGA